MDLYVSGIEPGSPALQADSLPAEPQGKPKNTGVGSLSLLQGIFPNQESNQGLLHYRWILYQLNYQGSPGEMEESVSFEAEFLGSSQQDTIVGSLFPKFPSKFSNEHVKRETPS